MCVLLGCSRSVWFHVLQRDAWVQGKVAMQYGSSRKIVVRVAILTSGFLCLFRKNKVHTFLCLCPCCSVLMDILLIHWNMYLLLAARVEELDCHLVCGVSVDESVFCFFFLTIGMLVVAFDGTICICVLLVSQDNKSSLSFMLSSSDVESSPEDLSFKVSTSNCSVLFWMSDVAEFQHWVRRPSFPFWIHVPLSLPWSVSSSSLHLLMSIYPCCCVFARVFCVDVRSHVCVCQRICEDLWCV